MKLGLLLFVLFGWVAPVFAGSCDVANIDIRDGGSSVRFSVEIVDTNESRALGLMNRPSIPQFSSMLFVYDRPRVMTFWMKNTLIPLDMLFVDETGTVQFIHENAVPLSEETINGGDNIQFVLEIRGGLSSILGLHVGAELRHPVFLQEIAVWPCE